MSSDRSCMPATSAPVDANPAGRSMFEKQWPFATPLSIIDEIATSVAPDETLTLTASTTIGENDAHLRAHFPGFAIFPGVFILEALRQAVAVALPGDTPNLVDIASVRSLRFLAPLRPGDHMRLKATLRPLAGGGWLADARVFRDLDTLAARLVVAFDAGDVAEAGANAEPARLPHAHPMRLIDRIVALAPGQSITAIKAVTATEPCYQALASGKPLASHAYPTALVLESFGQAAALLWFQSAGHRPAGVVMLASARNCHITGRAYPGDVLRHVAHLDNIVGDNVLVRGETWVGERRIATIESLLAAVRPEATLGTPVTEAASARS